MSPLALAVKLTLLGLLVAPAIYIHFRGRVRHRFLRQVTDHSTFMAPYNVLVYLFSGTPLKPILEVRDFPSLAPLRDNWRVIREEALALYDGRHIRAAEKYNDLAFNSFFRKGWKRFYVKWYDDALPSAKELCPRTVELVNSIPSVHAAMFALLEPRSKVGEHRDPFAGSLRYHLGLVTPNSDACRMWVDGIPYTWRDGEDLVFDETYMHRIANDTDQTRIILFCDVERPLRTPVMRAINRFATRHVMKLATTQNVADEKVGFFNKVFAYVYQVRLLIKAFKKWNRKVYYTVKFGVILGVLYLVIFGVRNWWG